MEKRIWINRKLIILVLLGFLSLQGFAQKLEVRAYIETQDGKGIDAATADLYEGSNKIKTFRSDSKGQISFELDYGKAYKIIITKGGMIQKRIDFVTNLPEDQKRNLVKEFGMSLVEDCDGANTAVFNEPVDIVRFDEGFGNFVSDQSHVQTMRSKITSAYASIEKCKKDKYAEKKAAADKAFKAGDYDLAQELYKEALEVFPNDSYAKRQISQSIKNNEKQNQNIARSEQLIAEGEQLMAQNQLSAATQRFTEALKLNPSNEAAKSKIKEIDQIVAQQAQQQAQEQALNNKYNDVLKQANSAMSAKNYAQAKQLYEEASKLKPNEPFPAQKIAMAQQAITKKEQEAAEAERQENLYQEAMAAGQAALANGDNIEAQKFFQNALAIKPKAQLPQQKIQEARNLEAERIQKEEQAKRDELERNYNEAIQKGNGLLAQKEYDGSIEAYNQALLFKPSDKFAKSQITKANNLKVEEQQQKQAAIEQAYASAMSLGDSKKTSQLFSEAIDAYKQALVSKPNDPVAMVKLNEAQKLLADKQRREKEETELRAKYNELIQQGDSYFSSLDYSNSKQSFQDALSLYPNEAYPNNKIATIDNILAKNQKEAEYNEFIAQADQSFQQQNFDNAVALYNKAKLVLPEKTYPQSQLNEISKIRSQQAKDKKQAEFDQLTAKAEQNIGQENYDEAKALYVQASQVIPENPYPQQRINEINQMISDKAKNKVLQEFNELKAQAEQEVIKENFDQAKALLTRAGTLMPLDPYPQKRINEINALISAKSQNEVLAEFNQLKSQAELEVAAQNYTTAIATLNKAGLLMPTDPFPQRRINEIKALIAQQSQNKVLDEFENLKARAEQQVSAENYVEAKGLLTQAGQLVPTDPYPQQRINEINKLIDERAKNKKLEAYTRLIQQADNLFNQQSYSEAKDVYLAALKENVESDYPQQKINEINQLLLRRSRAQVEGEYQAQIAVSDDLFNTQQYNQATAAYQKAALIMPEKTYPQQKINEINGLLANTDRLKREKEAEKASYDRTIALADKYFGEENYILARTEYNNALGIYPNEQYPVQQIAKIEDIVARQQQIESEKREQERKYYAAVQQADNLFKQKKYLEAKTYYEQAISLKLNDPHSTSQIQRIEQILVEQLNETQRLAELDTKYKNFISNADKQFTSHDYKLSKKLYLAALEVKPNEAYPRQQIKKIDETLKALASAPIKGAAPVNTQSKENNLEEIKFSNESEREKYFANLKSKYGKGITIETYKEGNKTTKRYIIIRNDEVREFREVKYSWGGSEYTVDGKPSNMMYFRSQVRPREGESVTKKDM